MPTPRPARFIPLALGLTLAATALLGIGQTVMPSFRTPQPPAAPALPPGKVPSGQPPLVYAELTKSGSQRFANDSFVWTWHFTDGVHPLPHAALLESIQIRPGAAFDDASIVNGIANLGWDLLSHSERAATTVPSISQGEASAGETFVVEHWWFKRR